MPMFNSSTKLQTVKAISAGYPDKTGQKRCRNFSELKLTQSLNHFSYSMRDFMPALAKTGFFILNSCLYLTIRDSQS